MDSSAQTQGKLNYSDWAVCDVRGLEHADIGELDIVPFDHDQHIAVKFGGADRGELRLLKSIVV